MPRLTTIPATIAWTDYLPINEYAVCPECGERCTATYSGPCMTLQPDHICKHFSDLCSTGGNGVGFMFWLTE